MYYPFITKKPIGVIFKNWKQGNIKLEEEIIKFLYDHCAEVRGYKNDNNFEDVLVRVKDAIDKIFSEDYEGAEEEIKGAYGFYKINFK